MPGALLRCALLVHGSDIPPFAFLSPCVAVAISSDVFETRLFMP